ncbi:MULTISPECIES: MrpF/PhaF family protein [unclassified Acinetobacter]|uniref:MrpF/PhaF family protein n=1 Tax=unclassified Acinetobacter TaxID=196816 RepID=UPI0015D3A317|nr:MULTISPECIES: MrpF/PhaF family protein [unclassified Acinetobacter]
MKKYSKILILALFGFTGTVAIASEPPIEATAAAEAQQVALEYGNEKDQKSESSGE